MASTGISGPSGASQGLSRQATATRNKWLKSEDTNERKRLSRLFTKQTGGEKITDYAERQRKKK